MQKGGLLLLFFLFPLLSFSTIFVLRESSITVKKPQVLGAQTKYIKKLKPQITLTPTLSITPYASPSTTLKKGIIKLQTSPKITTSPTDYILEEINEYRAKFNLSKIMANTETCSFAKTRAEEISNKFNHDGFNNRVTDKNIPYPSYSEVTENIAYNTDYTDVVDRWIASPGHEANMKKNTPFICIAKFGDYYAFEGWRP